MTLLMIF